MPTAPRALGVLLAGGLLVACGDDPEPGSAADTTTTTASGELVVETRPITAREQAELSDDDGNTPLGCGGLGGTEWDYGPIGADEEGREPVDALRDAVDDLNLDEAATLPTTGWIELVVDQRERVFALEDDNGDLIAAIMVSGDPTQGAWRHHEAFECPAARAPVPPG